VIAGAIIASRPPGYVVYPGYAQPVYGPGCYWASQPVYDGLGRVVGYTGRPVQVCPGYVLPPPPAPAMPDRRQRHRPLLLSFRQNEARPIKLGCSNLIDRSAPTSVQRRPSRAARSRGVDN
jgi:hypothetical protein